MAVDIDYYAVLGIARNANDQAIEAAVKKSMREWRKRTEAADLSVRQEAEVKVKQIDQARTILLDGPKRAAYDRDLAGGVAGTTAPAHVDSGNGQNWLDRAEGFLSIGDYNSAAYAAREATREEAANGRAWWVRSRANAGLKLWQDALYEARQAVQLDDSSADYHFNLGLVNEQMAQYGDAITEFRRAGTCDPSNPMYELAVGGIYLSNDRPIEALPIIEAVYTKYPQDMNANYYLGMALCEAAESIPKKRNRNAYMVTSEDEIRRMRELATRATSLNLVDDEVRKNSTGILDYLAEMEKKTFRPPWALIFGASALGSDAGCTGAALMFAFVLTIVLLPIILLIAGLASLGSSPGAGIIMLLIGAGLCWVWYKLMYIPKWKQNRRGA